MTILPFENHYPTDKTAQKLPNELTCQVAAKVYLWSLLIANLATIETAG